MYIDFGKYPAKKLELNCLLNACNKYFFSEEADTATKKHIYYTCSLIKLSVPPLFMNISNANVNIFEGESPALCSDIFLYWKERDILYG